MVVDICKYQGHIDWNKAVKPQDNGDKITGIIHRVCGRDLKLDSEIEYNLMSAINHGLTIDYYKFMYSRNAIDAYKEMKRVCELLNYIGALNSDIHNYPRIWLDFEKWDNRDYTKVELYNTYLGAREALFDMGYYDVGLYCNLNYIRNHVPNDLLLNTYLWLAQYSFTMSNDSKLAGYKIKYWQYSSKGRIDGIPNVVDLNKEFKIDVS